MGWLLGCFKCGQRRPTGSSLNLTASGKDGRGISCSAALLSANSPKAAESSKVERIFLVEGDEVKRNSSAYIKADKRSRSTRRPSPEQLLQVEKLEEEIDCLNKKLLEEATQATILTNEVRHLRKCSALLDSPNAFRKALNTLEQALEKGHLDESQPLLYLHSLLSNIQPSEEVNKTSSEERDNERQAGLEGFSQCINDSSLVTQKDWKLLENAHGKAIQVELDHSQGNIFSPVTIPRDLDEGQRHMLKEEQSTCNSRPQHSSDVVDIDAKKIQQISIVKKRSSTTLSFSGFLLVEDVTEERPISDKAVAVEQFSCTEHAVTKIIEKTDLSGENLVEASKSLFAFSTDSSQGHSTLTGKALVGNISKDFSLSNSDSEDDFCSVKPEDNGVFFNLDYGSPRCLWSPQDDNTHDLDIVHCSLAMEQCQIVANEISDPGFTDADELSLSSTFGNNSMDHISSLDSEESESQHGTKASPLKVLPQMHILLIKDKVSANKDANSHATVQAPCMSQPEVVSDAASRSCRNAEWGSSTEIQAGSVTRSVNKSVNLCQQSAVSVDPLKGCIAQEAGSEVKHCFRSSLSEGEIRNEKLEKTNQGESVFFENLKQSSINEAPLKIFDKITSSEEDSLCVSQEQFSSLGGETIVELSSPGTTSVWSPYTQTSPYDVHTLSPLQPVGDIEERPSGCLLETPSTPVSVNSHESVLHLVRAEGSEPKFTPSRTPLASLTQTQTPSTINSRSSPPSLGEDRPILGTVAAHWNPSSASSTQKWWDGKGIPNSTNKYREDQKVSWHATPFEVRLERALAKQGRVFQKKLFTGAMATEMKVTM